MRFPARERVRGDQELSQTQQTRSRHPGDGGAQNKGHGLGNTNISKTIEVNNPLEKLNHRSGCKSFA